MTNDTIHTFESKIEEYFLSCQRDSIKKLVDRIDFTQWPAFKFNITSLFKSLQRFTDTGLHDDIACKLVDIKLNYVYLKTLNQHFLQGPSLIVGNNEYEKLNPDTISLLRLIQNRLFLLSLLAEQILDLLWMVFENEVTDKIEDKWNTIIKRIRHESQNKIFSDKDKQLLMAFKDNYRDIEIHSWSAVREMTSKPEWNHLQAEENLVDAILERLMRYFVDRDIPN